MAYCFSILGLEAATPKKPTICLNMIVKNESKVIERCLASVKKLGIDYWVIVDTGSTDGTQKIIRKCMQDIPGKLYERPWKNFAHNRNEALVLAKKKADYVLFIDADEELEFDENFVMPVLNKDCYLITIHTELSNAKRMFLVNNHLDWKWKGVIHEDISCPRAKTFGALINIRNLAIAKDGQRSQDPDKYRKDIQLLEKALEEEPHNSRYVFYLAQSYCSSSQYALALQNYEKRATMGGNEEEIFWSLYMIGEMQELLNKPADMILNSYNKAYSFRPSRAEPLFRLSNLHSKQKRYAQGYSVAKFALALPVPVDSHLILHWIYDYGLLCAFSEAALHLGKYDEAREAIEKVLMNPHIMPDVREQAETCLHILKTKTAYP